RVGNSRARAKHGLMGIDVVIVLHSGPSINRLEVRSDLWPTGLEEWGEHKTLAKCCRIFIDRKPGSIRSNFEEHPVRLTNIKAAKPMPIDLAAIRNSKLVQSIGPGIVLSVNAAEGNVMNTARALLNDGEIGLDSDVQFRVRPAAAHFKHMHLRRGIVRIWAITHLAHVEDARKKDVRRIECRHANDNGAESSNLPFTRNRAAV